MVIDRIHGSISFYSVSGNKTDGGLAFNDPLFSAATPLYIACAIHTDDSDAAVTIC
jgi:hypothetical protein